MKFIHRENFAKRYQYLASFVEKGDLVLEPGCGPAILADFLPKDCFYYGFDLNENFINYARKKHPGVYLGNVLDPANYFPAEVIISCDVLHHLKPEFREKFIENCWQKTKKKFIICEPAKEEKQSKWWFEHIERDGENLPKLEDFWTERELKNQMINGFGKIKSFYPRLITKIGKDLIAVYFKK